MTPVPSVVRWAELKPDEFRARRDAFPVVYLPLGLCEPHGHVAALGLDLIKAEYYCDTAARRFGGIVAPSQGYHIHEAGFHAPWLAEVVGDENPLLAGLPPHVLLHHLLYQLRAFALAGFSTVVLVSGHAGGNEFDLRRVADAFAAHSGMKVVARSDPEWVAGRYTGDHAGRYEISQLLAIRPDLVDLRLIDRRHAPGSGGRLALGDDAAEGNAALGREINEAVVNAIGTWLDAHPPARPVPPPRGPLDYGAMEELWRRLLATMPEWRTVRPYPHQSRVPEGSRWARYAEPLPDLVKS